MDAVLGLRYKSMDRRFSFAGWLLAAKGVFPPSYLLAARSALRPWFAVWPWGATAADSSRPASIHLFRA